MRIEVFVREDYEELWGESGPVTTVARLCKSANKCSGSLHYGYAALAAEDADFIFLLLEEIPAVKSHERTLSGRIKTQLHDLVSAEPEPQAYGFACLQFNESNPDAMHLTVLFAMHDGGKLLAAVIQFCLATQRKYLCLESLETSMGFYRQFGFEFSNDNRHENQVITHLWEQLSEGSIRINQFRRALQTYGVYHAKSRLYNMVLFLDNRLVDPAPIQIRSIVRQKLPPLPLHKLIAPAPRIPVQTSLPAAPTRRATVRTLPPLSTTVQLPGMVGV